MSVAGIEHIDAMYRGEFRSPSGTVMLPPWEIGKPQPAMVNVVASGQVRGRVLDVGCGTGELALYVAALGYSVVGIDAAPTAIAVAERKAAERGASVHFEVGDATELAGHVEAFDTVLDVGLLHGVLPDDQPRYLAALRRACRPDALLHVLCFSETISVERLRELFSDGWHLAEPAPATILARVPDEPQQRQWIARQAGELAEAWSGAEAGDLAPLPAWLVTARAHA
jgi:SAM-dependent methyltransferase